MSTRLYSRIGQMDVSRDGEDFLTLVTEEVLCNFSKELHYVIEKASKYDESSSSKKVKVELTPNDVSEQDVGDTNNHRSSTSSKSQKNTESAGERMVTRSRGEALLPDAFRTADVHAESESDS